MNNKLKLASIFLALSIGGTIAFFLLLIMKINNSIDKGNEWLSPKVFILIIIISVLTAVIGTLIAMNNFKQPKGKVITYTGLSILMVHGCYFFANGSSNSPNDDRSPTITMELRNKKIDSSSPESKQRIKTSTEPNDSADAAR